ncbi:phospholipase D-like domain-containing protein [Pararhodobacter zhoushanensis]|uniref:phospholipase D-like domain-containing protein n=1 Tax=Pararhodobacter zhoushanensis TaxID=2479545 RepID=UPI000F8D7A97|nr:phosphatidylserine/phosphatidylglycerophosphate/cardiolipin synthase family protein [Pararhodobacter zhoushanensis]
MHWQSWIVIALLVAGAGALMTLWATGRFAKRKRGKATHVLPAGSDTRLDALMEPLERAHPGLTGARLVPVDKDALTLRLALAHSAERSLDLMYYIWEDDLSGRLLAQAVLDAADRGVRVRMLFDDVNTLNRDPTYRALDRHPRIEVRLFNPIRNRDRGVLRGLEILFNLMPYNRRMHNKMWLADQRLAISGGRNVGDAYFGLQRGWDTDYDDLDMLLSGAVLRDMGALYDRFWNSGLSLPVRRLWLGKSTRLKRFRRNLNRILAKKPSQERIEKLDLPLADHAEEVLNVETLRWSDGLSFIGDPPEKTLGTRRNGWMASELMPLLQSAKRELRIMTPYFVPGGPGLKALVDLQKSGVQIEIITNGLRRTDSVLVYGAYRWYRPRLLAAGIKLVEAATPGAPDTMVHAKTFIVDGQRAFVGSFNFDLRSAFLNTELGMLFDDPGLIEDLTALFEEACTPDKAWRLSMDGRFIRWQRGDESTHTEPGTTAWKRVLTFAIGHLPIHRFL